MGGVGGRAGVAGSRARTHAFECLSSVPAGGGLGAARWRGRGPWPGCTVGDKPPPQQSGWLRLQGLGQGWKELRPANIYHSRALAKALTTPHLNPQTEAPGPDQPMPLLLPPAPGRRGKRPSPGGPSPGSPSKMQSKPKQTKTKQVFNRKNKGNCGKMWHLAMPSPQLCCPLPGLAEACPHPHAHLVQLSPLWA